MRSRLAMLVAALASLASTTARTTVGALRPETDRINWPARQTPHATRTVQLGLALAGARIVSVGEAGVALYSDDEGRHWTQARVPVSVTLTAVQFATPRIGWAVGHDGVVLRSDDAGASWVRQLDGNTANKMMMRAAQEQVAAAQTQLQAAATTASPATRQAAEKALEQARSALQEVQAGTEFGPSRPLLGLWFANEQEGYVVGAFGQLFHTADGGRSWHYLGNRLPNPDGLHLQAVRGVGPQVLLVASEAGHVFRSDDRGQSWQALNTGYAGTLFGVLALDGSAAQVLLAYGFAGRVFRSANGGRNWLAVEPGQKRPTLVAAHPLDGKDWLLLGQDGSSYRSLDDGRSLHPGPRSPGLRVAGFVLAPEGRGLVTVGQGGIHIGERVAKP